MSENWKSSAACDPSTRNGRRRIVRGQLHLSAAGGMSFCGISLSDASHQSDFRKCWNCKRLAKWADLRRERAQSKRDELRWVTPCLCVVLAALACGRVVIDEVRKTATRRHGGDLVVDRLPQFFYKLQDASRAQWLAMKYPESRFFQVPK